MYAGTLLLVSPQISLCRPSQSALELESWSPCLSVTVQTTAPWNVSSSCPGCYIFSASQTLMFCSTVEPLFLYFSCNCVHQFTLCCVCFCPVAKWAHCWQCFQMLPLPTLRALSSSLLAVLVCSKGSFFSLSFFLFLFRSPLFSAPHPSLLHHLLWTKPLLLFNSHSSSLRWKWNLSLMSNVLSHYIKWHELESNNLPVYIF